MFRNTARINYFCQLELEIFNNFIDKFNTNGESQIIICPENGLTTKDQKNIPSKIQTLSDQNPGQIFYIYTNSPFIIATVANSTYYPESSQINQRVYSIQNPDGVWGKKAGLVASSMIIEGIGINTENKNKIEIITPKSQTPILIFCEGQGEFNDASIYNKIFERFGGHNVLFISSKGCSQVTLSFQLINQIKQNLSTDFEILMLRDRDHEFPTMQNIIDYKQEFPGRKVLEKRAIECYLFNSEITNLLLLQLTGKKMPESLKIQFDELNNEIQLECETGILGNEYKKRLKSMYFNCTKKLVNWRNYQFEKDYNFNIKEEIYNFIIPLIGMETETYQDLSNSIFS